SEARSRFRSQPPNSGHTQRNQTNNKWTKGQRCLRPYWRGNVGEEHEVDGSRWTVSQLRSHKWWKSGGRHQIRVRQAILAKEVIYGGARRTSQRSGLFPRRETQARGRCNSSNR